MLSVRSVSTQGPSELTPVETRDCSVDGTPSSNNPEEIPESRVLGKMSEVPPTQNYQL